MDKNTVKIRFIKKEDIPRVLDIYTPYILNTVITFEYTVPTLEAFEQRVENITRQFPWLVYEAEGKIAGYAYASPFASRAAYSWDCELSVYLDSEYHGRGIGKALYKRLLELVKQQGYYNAYALIALPNDSSIALHEHMGFEKQAIFKKAGYKFNRWIDLIYLVKRLQDFDIPPKELSAISELHV